MELLPIIYISLAIFAVVAIATIITSFITYKIRLKTDGYIKPYDRAEDPSNKNYMKKKIMDSDGKFNTVISDERKSKQKHHKKEQLNKSAEKTKSKSPSKTIQKNTETRIKILNQSNKIHLPSLPKKEKAEKSDKELKELKELKENILNKYTDDKNEEFFSPKISTKKNSDRK